MGEFFKYILFIKKIISDADADIVLSLTWRNTFENLVSVEKQLDFHGITKVIDCTPLPVLVYLCKDVENCR